MRPPLEKYRQCAETLDGIRDDHLERYHFAAAQARRRHLAWAFDVGCGVGYGSWILAEEAGLVVFGHDRDERAIYYGEEHYRHPLVLRAQGELRDLVIPDARTMHGQGEIRGLAADEDMRRAGNMVGQSRFGLIAAFEIIEHSIDAPAFLARAAERSFLLVGSVPNEDLVPFATTPNVNPEHVRHYRPQQIHGLLAACGWRVVMLGCQTGKRGAEARVREDTSAGRTLVFVAKSTRL